jgi:hypothetical protein
VSRTTWNWVLEVVPFGSRAGVRDISSSVPSKPGAVRGSPDAVSVGRLPLVAWVALLPVPDLSAQQPTVLPAVLPVQVDAAYIDAASAPSSQRLRPVVTGRPANRDSAVLAGPVPVALVAVTVTLYSAPPPASPVRVQVVEGWRAVQVTVGPPAVGTAVTVYPVTTDPPFQVGAVQATAALVPAAVGDPVTAVGACGAMVRPHLRARYSSTCRFCGSVAAWSRTTTSAIRPCQ